MFYTPQFVLCLVSILLQAKAATIKRVSVDIGKNVTIKCPLNNARDVMWERETNRKSTKMTVLEGGSLFLESVDRSDSGIYNCIRENDVKDIKGRVNVTVRTPPPPLIVSIKCSTILVLVLWEVLGTGGYPITYFTAQYRTAFINSSWIPISPNHIMPSSRQIEVYNLRTNTTYEFRMWATNQLGKSPVTYVLATTKGQYPEIGADKFDTTWWAAAVGVVLGTLVLLGLGTCALLCRECQRPTIVDNEPEIIELVPNIILNPGFEGSSRFSDLTPDENSNSEILTLFNNNTVVHPQDL